MVLSELIVSRSPSAMKQLQPRVHVPLLMVVLLRAQPVHVNKVNTSLQLFQVTVLTAIPVAIIALIVVVLDVLSVQRGITGMELDVCRDALQDARSAHLITEGVVCVYRHMRSLGIIPAEWNVSRRCTSKVQGPISSVRHLARILGSLCSGMGPAVMLAVFHSVVESNNEPNSVITHVMPLLMSISTSMEPAQPIVNSSAGSKEV